MTIGGNVKGKNGMPSNVRGGGTYYEGNLTDRGYPDSRGAYGGSTGGSTGGSSSGSKSGSSSSRSSASLSGSSSSTADAYNALLAAYRQNDYSDYLNQMRAAAQAAYDRGMSTLNSAYDSQLSSLADNLSQTRSQLKNQYNRSKKNIIDDATESLKQAYINKRRNEVNLGQQMAALGLTGGATESTMANMLNNYGNARNDINTTQNKNLSNLEGNYSDNLSQAIQAYNSAVANANLQKAQQAMSLENMLASNQISALGDYQNLMQRENQNYLDLLKTAIANGASFSYDPTSANNAFNAVAVKQASPTTTNTNYAAIQSMLNQATPTTATPGYTVLNPSSSDTFLDILAQLQKAGYYQ